MLASTWMDPVLGVDIHIVAVPSPAGPVPTPLPHPFIGMVFDPMGMVVGAAISTALGAGPTMTLVNSMPATNCGTEVMAMPPHIPTPPGVAHPKPPDNDAELMFGGMQGGVEGSFGVRLGDIALSCGDPVRMPTSTVLAVPKGAPVMNMKPMSPDLMTIAMAGAMKAGMKGLGAAGRKLRAMQRSSKTWKRASDAMKNKLDAVTPQRMRGLRDRAVCFVTGHPVDVATGRMFTEFTDLELPGPLPLKFERAYDTSFSWRDGAMGPGWSHTFESSLWLEPGKVVLKAEDGRELEFSTLDFKDRVMRDGQSMFDPVYRMTLTCTGPMRFEVQEISGVVHKYEPVPGGDPNVAQRVQKRDRTGFHVIEFHYDEKGRVEWVRDCGGRLVGLEYEKTGRLSALKVPLAKGHGHRVHRRFFYGKDGDLERIEDSLGHSWTFDYVDHLMVQETDRTGLSFHFQYDRFGPGAKCIRTWGDGGIYDHVISYTPDNKKTIVEDSIGAVTIYEMDDMMQVVAVTDPMAGTTKYGYDSATGRMAIEEDPLGGQILSEFDSRGNLVAATAADGTITRLSYDVRFDLPLEVTDPLGRVRRWNYDDLGRVVSVIDPAGRVTTHRWSSSGLLDSIRLLDGSEYSFDYDEAKQLVGLGLPNGASVKYRRDRLGRTSRIDEPTHGVRKYERDTESRVVRLTSPTGLHQDLRYDPEGNLLEKRRAGRRVSLEYGNFHRLVGREEDGTRVAVGYDTEGRVTSMVNEAGEVCSFELDSNGRLSSETAFDGALATYLRDANGRVTTVISSDGLTKKLEYDACGRLLASKSSDGTLAEFEYDAGGQLVRATNESADVRFELDPLGRVSAESQDGGATWVRSEYHPSGRRLSISSDLGAAQEVELGTLGEVVALVQGAAGAQTSRIEFQRDARGRETGRRLPGGVSIRWERDSAGRPVRRFTEQETAPTMGRVEAREPTSYVWEGEGQLRRITGGPDGAVDYEHDARGRLIRERRADRWLDRSLDAVGNVFRSEGHDDRRYGAGGRLLAGELGSYEYDASGNQTRRIDSEGRRWEYSWNGGGMLTSATQPDGRKVEFGYDAFARRTSKRIVRVLEDGSEEVEREYRFVWDGHNVLHELDSTEGMTTWYWEPGRFTPVLKERDGDRWSVASDHLGTPSEMYDSTGALAWKMQLDLHGVPSFSAGTAEDCPWRWPGQYEDSETGDYYNRWRYYSPEEDRYRSADPLSPWSSFTPFGYVRDPLSSVDPFGLLDHQHHTIPKQLVQEMNDAGMIDMDDDTWKEFKSTKRDGLAPLAADKGAHAHSEAHKALTDSLDPDGDLGMTRGTQKGPEWQRYLESRNHDLDAVLHDFDKFHGDFLPNGVKAGDYPLLDGEVDNMQKSYAHERATIQGCRK